MTTALTERPLTKPVILYSVTPETIAEMATRYAGLTINGIEDKTGYETVQKARMDCVKARSAVEKQRKEMKADALEFGRKVDSEAKLLTAKIEADKRAAEQAELDRQRAEIKAEQDRLAKIERDRLESERLEKAKAEAAEKARIETEARLKREAEEAERKRLAEEEAAKRAEALKPVRQKLEDFAAKVKLLPLPNIDEVIAGSIQHVLDVAANDIVKIAKGLK